MPSRSQSAVIRPSVGFIFVEKDSSKRCTVNVVYDIRRVFFFVGLYPLLMLIVLGWHLH